MFVTWLVAGFVTGCATGFVTRFPIGLRLGSPVEHSVCIVNLASPPAPDFNVDEESVMQVRI